MTDNLTPTAPARFYGFARTRTIAENLAALKAFQEAACTEAPAGGEAECAPSTSTELVHVSARRRSRPITPSPSGYRALLIAQPPLDQQTPEPEPIKKRKRLKKKRQRHKTVTEEPQPPSPAMHEAQCMICNSEYREEMDELFVNWHNVSEIAREYNTPRRTRLSPRARRSDYFRIRDRNLRRSLGLIIHRAETVPCLTVDSVIRAVRTLAHINETGEWVNPPTHVIVSSGTAVRANKTAPAAPELLDTPCQAIESVKP